MGCASENCARQIRTTLEALLDALPALIEQSHAEGWFTPMILDVANDTRKRIDRLTGQVHSEQGAEPQFLAHFAHAGINKRLV